MRLNDVQTVLFYSFKGGVGRTQLMLNSAKHLASKGKKILMVDFDIHAPGLSYWKYNTRIKQQDEDYLLSFIVQDFAGKDTSRKIFTKELDENLYLAPIYDMTAIMGYHKLLVDLSAYLYDIKTKAHEKVSHDSELADIILENFVDKLMENESYDYIFFDARTGFTEISDILFSKRVDLKVLVSAYNKQNVKGINAILNLISKNSEHKHKILRILSLKPKNCDNKLIEQLKSEANLDDDKELKDKFYWNDVMEIDYSSDIVINDFDVWENITSDNLYKQQVIDIANQLNSACIGDKFEL